MKFDAILFDMDGVIVESETASLEYFKQRMEEAGHSISQAQLESLIGLNTADSVKTLVKMIQPPLSHAEVEELVRGDLFTQRVCQGAYDIPLVEGFSALAQAFAGRMKYAIASGSPIEVIEYHMQKYSLKPMFSAFVSSEKVPQGKPAPDVYLEAAKRLGVPASRCIVIEDAPAGILAGKSAGAHTIAVPTRYTKRFDFSPADKICASLTEARTYIQTLTA